MIYHLDTRKLEVLQNQKRLLLVEVAFEIQLKKRGITDGNSQ